MSTPSFGSRACIAIACLALAGLAAPAAEATSFSGRIDVTLPEDQGRFICYVEVIVTPNQPLHADLDCWAQ